MKENLQQSLRKIKILEDRVEQLRKVKRPSEAIVKAKKLFHLSTSFTVILLLNENFELFEEMLSVAMRSWDTLMRLHTNHTFNLYWKKQVLAFELLALLHAQKKKFKTGLKAIYEAQTIVSELDETVERNLDYIMAVNTLTGFLLLSIHKPHEALEFILIAERIVYKLVDMHKKERVRQSYGPAADGSVGAPTSLEIIGEQKIEDNQIGGVPITINGLDEQAQNSQRKIFGVPKMSDPSNEEEKQSARLHQRNMALNQNSADGLEELVGKRSCLSPTLLSNYVLGISLLKNIAMKYSNLDSFESNFEMYMGHVRQVEQALFQLGSVDCMPDSNQASGAALGGSDTEEKVEQMFNGVAVSFLIKQHKIEILDNEELSFQDLVNETFNKEFMNMIQVCIFVPFLHLETPKPQNVPKVPAIKENLVPHADLIKEVLNFRLKVGAVQKAKLQERKERQQMHELEMHRQAQSINNSSVVVGNQMSMHSDGPDVIGIFDESTPTMNHPQIVQPQIFAMDQPRKGNTSLQRPKKYPSTTRVQKRSSVPAQSKLPSTGVPQLTDINQFASLVDPRHGSQKRRFKISQDRPPMRGSGYSQNQSPKPIQRRMGSLQPATASLDTKTTGLEINKIDSTISSARRGTSVVHDHRLSMTIHSDWNKHKASWVKPVPEMKPITQYTSNYERFPNLQPLRTVTADNITSQKTQSQTRRPRRQRQAPSGIGLRSELTARESSKPLEQLLADQRIAEERMRKFVKGARQHDENIERILTSNQNDWSSLYSHPKLMGQYYWKDDSIHTNKQRAAQIKNVISSGYDFSTTVRGKRVNATSSSLLQPVERQSVQK